MFRLTGSTLPRRTAHGIPDRERGARFASGKTHRGAALALAIASLIAQSPALGSIRAACGIIPNRGQLAHSVRYYASCDLGTFYFADTAIVLDLVEESRTVRIRFEGTSPEMRIEPRGEREATVSSFMGGNPAAWAGGMRTYDELVYHEVWPGIDLRFRPEGRELRYEITGGSAFGQQRSALRFDGIDRADTAAGGFIRLGIPPDVGDELLPDRERNGSCVRRFRSEHRDRHRRTSFEPSAGTRRDDHPSPEVNHALTLSWSTFLGGSTNDYPHGLAMDSLGNLIVTGYTQSLNFPTTAGSYDRTQAGSYDVFVAKFGSDGSQLIWATFIGGGWEDRPFTDRLGLRRKPDRDGAHLLPRLSNDPRSLLPDTHGRPRRLCRKAGLDRQHSSLEHVSGGPPVRPGPGIC